MEIVKKNFKEKNPKERANPISKLLFLYMFPIFIKNYKKGVIQESLYQPLNEHRSKDLGDKLHILWKDATVKYKRFALHIALFKLFGVALVLTGLLKLFLELALVVILPTIIDKVVSYFDSDSKTSLHEATIYTVVLVCSLFIDVIIEHHTMLILLHTCMKMRVACCSLIYRKSLKLSRTSLGKTTVGQIVNLLSNDVSKFEQNFVLCHYIFIGPIQTILVTYLLYRILGVAAFAGIAFLVAFVPLQIYLGKKISVLRLRTALRTDERIRLMHEILNGIQVIKMYTWEKPFAKLIDYARRKEIQSIRAHFCLESIMFSLEMFITRTCLFINLIVIIALGGTISAEMVYSATAIYNFIRPVMTMLFSISITAYAEVHISVCRIQEFLRYEEQSELPHNVTRNKVYSTSTPKLCMKNLCAKWVEDSGDTTLSDLNLDVESNKLIAIVGAVGSGKSSLFNLILKEVSVTEGNIEIQGTISYASQEPWLFSASVRQNILFCEKYNEERYKAVLKVCALEPDLVTFPHGDQTLIGEKGKLLSGGQKARINLARCIYKEADIYLLDDPLSAVDTKVGKDLFEKCIKGFLNDKMCLLITHQLQYLNRTDKIMVLEEGKIVDEGTFNELQSSSSNFSKILHQYSDDDNPDQVEKVKRQRSRQNSERSQTYDGLEEDDVEEEKELLVMGDIKSSVYFSYFKAGGNYLIILFVLLAFVGNQVITNAGDYYISYWVTLEQKAIEANSTLDRDPIIYTYSGLTGGTIILAIGHNLLFFLFAMRASITLHNDVFTKITKASMAYYNANPTGRILNRFSKDIGSIDDYIPFLITDIFEVALTLLGAVVLSAIVNFWFLIPSVLLFVIFYFFRLVFLQTSRNTKRLEGINRSPIITHLTTSISGLSTIRAFSAQNMLIEEYDDLQDNYSSASFLFILASRAFAFWLDIIANVFICGMILSLLLIPSDYYGGEIGLVITQYLGVYGILQWGMRQWTELENNMTSVERVLELNKVQMEPVRTSLDNIPNSWPEFGKIVFENVSMSYLNNLKVLQDLNFTIYPGEKIGIVGRTGAGKTSTISALYQLYEIEGSIIIDGVDTTKLSLDLLRSKISIIPQEPMLFKGTLRRNLDPFEEYSDDILWNALEQVELKPVAFDSPEGLNMSVSENGSNFSIGQRQLICLARAIIRNNKILIMDEATANVDPYTDNLIQKTIRINFLHSTVITIAHRLHTIMDSDKVLVIDGGKVAEYDHPYNLLQLTSGIFYAMVETTGSNTSKNLSSIAEESFAKRKTNYSKNMEIS